MTQDSLKTLVVKWDTFDKSKASLKTWFLTIVGGEIHEYGKLLTESRKQALDRMVPEAKSLGANAILNVRFATSMVMQGSAEMLAYGTAVVLQGE